MKYLPKIWSGILFGTVLMPFLFFLFSFCSRQWIRIEMEEKLELYSLTTITVSLENIVWVEEGKEVLINGHLFDINSYKLEEKNIQLTGLFDEDEDKILKKINTFFDDVAGENSLRELSIGFLFLPFWRQNKLYAFLPGWKFLPAENNTKTTENFPEPTLSVTAPPPKNIL